MRTQLVLTQRGVEAAKPKAKRYGKPDGTVPGLRLVVFPSGEKTYALFTRVNGRLINHKIGSASVLGLASARKEARRKLEEISGGQDPRETRREAKRAESETVEVVTGRFIERYVKPKNKSWKEIQRKFDVEVLPHWGKRPISSITQRDVIELLDSIVDRGGLGTQANRVLASIRRLFNWSIERGLVSQSPTDRVKAPVPETPRDRVLSDSELALILRAADIVGHPFGPYFKILILTGTRREEVAGMRWSELDPDLTTWTIPRERVKNGIEHTIPLAPWARSIVGTLPRIAGSGGFAFTVNGRNSISGYSKAKRELDAAISSLNGGIPIASWRIHDLRRTFATGLARLGVQLPVVEKLLNHTSGSFAGVAGVYQRHNFSDEKRHALERWGTHVGDLVSDHRSPNVVRLETRA